MKVPKTMFLTLVPSTPRITSQLLSRAISLLFALVWSKARWAADGCLSGWAPGDCCLPRQLDGRWRKMRSRAVVRQTLDVAKLAQLRIGR